MHPSVNNDFQSPTTLDPDFTVKLSSSQLESAQGGENKHRPGILGSSLPEDIVTFSDSSNPRTKAEPSDKNSSLPVSNTEKKALLRPVSSRYGFSIYG